MSVESCWRVHSTLEASSAKADAKASILLAFQGGGLILAATSTDVIAPVGGVPAYVTACGVAMIIAAMLLAALAIAPSLGSSSCHTADRRDEWIYFGHVRQWDSTGLAARMGRLSEQDQVRALAAQLVAISRITWRKHRLLQGSVALTLAAIAVIVMAVAMKVWA